MCALCGHDHIKVDPVSGLGSCTNPECGVKNFVPGEGVCYVEKEQKRVHISHAVAALKGVARG